jgi:hypothetical protein
METSSTLVAFTLKMRGGGGGSNSDINGTVAELKSSLVCVETSAVVSLGNTGGSHVYTYVFKKLTGNSSSSDGFLLSMMCVCVCSSVSVRYGGVIRTRAVPVN